MIERGITDKRTILSKGTVAMAHASPESLHGIRGQVILDESHYIIYHPNRSSFENEREHET